MRRLSTGGLTMSLDTEVWVAREVSLHEVVRVLPGEWEQFGDDASWDGEGWQVLVMESEEANADEADPGIPAELVRSRPFRVSVTVEPIGAPPPAIATLTDVMTALVNEFDGVALHPDSSDVMTTTR